MQFKHAMFDKKVGRVNGRRRKELWRTLTDTGTYYVRAYVWSNSSCSAAAALGNRTLWTTEER